jgi:hypothetical protein
MSLEQWANEDWMLAIGVDPVSSVFVQVWKQPTDEQDGALIIVDNQGVSLSVKPEELPAQLAREVAYLERRFQIGRDAGNRRPNLHADDVIKIASTVGFSGEKFRRSVRHLLD